MRMFARKEDGATAYFERAIICAMRLSLIALLCTLVCLPLSADDGASSISAGGLVATREPRITMAKEVLLISLKRVVVDYDFRNDTDAPVTTEIAFPIPGYTSDPGENADPARAGFDDFKLFIGGKPHGFETEIKAVVKGRDVSGLLRRDHIDVATFGHLGDNGQSPDLKTLGPAQVRELVASGAYRLDGADASPDWTVEKRYHWTQTFPAKSVVHIRHEYSPVSGSQLVPTELLSPLHKVQPDEKYAVEDVTSMCVAPATLKALGAKNGTLLAEWVDFILTTANSWKRPIEDFTLIVERTDPKDTVSFCWDGPVTKLDANHFQAHTVNLVPSKELHIGFYWFSPAR